MAKKRSKKEFNDNPLPEELSEIISTHTVDKVSRDITFKHNGEWANLPGKRMKRASEINPLVNVRDGIDDASCLEVEVIDASIYMPLTDKKLQPVFSSTNVEREAKIKKKDIVDCPASDLEAVRCELAFLKKQRKLGEINEDNFITSKTVILKKMEKIRRLELRNIDQNVQRNNSKIKKRKKKTQKNLDAEPDEGNYIEEDVSVGSQHHATPIAWNEFGLHHKIGRALSRSGFMTPTPIQRAVMSPALGTSQMGARDVMGAAQTGSGKTLAYGLPVLDWWFRRRDELEAAPEKLAIFKSKLVGLVLCPTRELALQVSTHLNQIVELTGEGKQKLLICTLVGGLSEEKQTRQLDKSPAIVVGTVGRIWEMMSQGHPHFKHVNRLRFLIIDEADRMVQKGSFAELDLILKEVTKPVRRANKTERAEAYRAAMAEDKTPIDDLPEDEVEEEVVGEDADNEEEEKERDSRVLTLSKQSVRKLQASVESDELPLDAGEVELVMWRDIQQNMEEVPGKTKKDSQKRKRKEIIVVEEGEVGEDEWVDNGPRQSFIFSATLTLEDVDRKLVILNRKQQKLERKWKQSGNKKKLTEGNALLRIMESIGLRGEPFIADLTASPLSLTSGEDTGQKRKTPPNKLSKDAYLYHFLLLQQSHHNRARTVVKKLQMDQPSEEESETGLRVIVFVNAIPAARRLSATLALLDVNAICIHAEMQQRQRLKQLDKFKAKEPSHMVLVATDVAARGLDIPNVNAVVHYDLPRTADAFIHRSGRTARAGTCGTALTLIAQAQLTAYSAIMDTVLGPRFAAKLVMKNVGTKGEEETNTEEGKEDAATNPTHLKPHLFVQDTQLLKVASERAHVAAKIVKLEDGVGRNAASNNWYRQQAKAMEIELDDSIQEQEMNMGQSSEPEMRRLRQTLNSLLSLPLNGKKPEAKRLKKSGTSITNQQARRKKKR